MWVEVDVVAIAVRWLQKGYKVEEISLTGWLAQLDVALGKLAGVTAIGYDSGDAHAEWAADIPDSLTSDDDPECHWPRDKLLQACGGELLPFHPDLDPKKVKLRKQMGVRSAAVRLNGRIFVAGDVVENVSRRQRKPGPNLDN